MRDISEHLVDLKAAVITHVGTGFGIIGALAVWQEQFEFTLKILVAVAAISASVTSILVGRKNLKQRREKRAAEKEAEES